MTDWDYGRCKSLLEEVSNGAGRIVFDLGESNPESFRARDVLHKVDQLFNAMRKVKALLVRERKSKA